MVPLYHVGRQDGPQLHDNAFVQSPATQLGVNQSLYTLPAPSHPHIGPTLPCFFPLLATLLVFLSDLSVTFSGL